MNTSTVSDLFYIMSLKNLSFINLTYKITWTLNLTRVPVGIISLYKSVKQSRAFPTTAPFIRKYGFDKFLSIHNK